MPQEIPPASLSAASGGLGLFIKFPPTNFSLEPSREWGGASFTKPGPLLDRNRTRTPVQGIDVGSDVAAELWEPGFDRDHAMGVAEKGV